MRSDVFLPPPRFGEGGRGERLIWPRPEAGPLPPNPPPRSGEGGTGPEHRAMIQTHCPDAARWHALIADPDLPDYVELEAHLAHCPRCQTLVDEVAVGDSGWLRDAGRLAASTGNDPEMTRTLHRL